MASEALPGEMIPSSSPPCGSGPSWRILLVEDDAVIADVMASWLRLRKYEVQVASNGPGALQQAEEELPDVVLLDIGLPEMDGWEVARRLRELPWKKRPVVIAVTSFGQDTDRLRSYEAGIDLHLTKPVALEELETLLRKVQRTQGG